MAKTTELQTEGSKLSLQKELSEKMRARLTLTNKVSSEIIFAYLLDELFSGAPVQAFWKTFFDPFGRGCVE